MQTGIFGSLNNVSKWEARRLLMDKLMRFPALRYGNSGATNFYNTWLNTSAGRFAQVESQIREAYAIEPADQTYMDYIESQRGNIQVQLIALANGQTIPGTPTTNPTFAAATEVLLTQLRPLHTQEVALKAQIRQKQVAKLQAALATNNLLFVGTTNESNRRLFNHLSIQLFLNGTLNTTEEAQLLALTADDQAEGGLAVDDAKKLLPKCNGNNARLSRNRSNEAEFGKNLGSHPMILFPNPVSETLSIQLSTDATGQIQLFDLTGQLWLKQTKRNGEAVITMDTNAIPSGIYFVSFQSDTGNQNTQKVLIQH